MPPIRFGNDDLLQYNSDHGILICRQCQYAIQKNALKSHLLRHKIYRDDRQSLLAKISKLELLEPDDVPLPSPTAAPVDALPIISGYRCRSPGCGNLLASVKRMKRHWSECHEFEETAGFNDLAAEVKMQTFFRGTKIKYFEVTPVAEIVPHEPEQPDITSGFNREDNVSQDGNPDSRPRQPSPEVGPRYHPVNVDLRTLTYFHHFITNTSLALPRLGTRSDYWQTIIVPNALWCRWIMCGILALSACHLADLSTDTETTRIQHERTNQYFSIFHTGRENQRRMQIAPGGLEESVRKAGDQIYCFIRCAFWTSPSPPAPISLLQERTHQSPLTTLVDIIRVLPIPDEPAHIDNDNGSQDTIPENPTTALAEAHRVLRTFDPSSPISASTSAFPMIPPDPLLVRLNNLSSLMTGPFLRPTVALELNEVVATLLSIARLIRSYESALSSSTTTTAFLAFVNWLTRLSSLFYEMLEKDGPATLVVMAHAGAALVHRAVETGCWFLKGVEEGIRRVVEERLDNGEQAVRRLVIELDNL